MAIRHPGREIEILAEIKPLKESIEAKDEELKQQRRIIEDLSYRHIMENIIGPNKWTGNYASDWRVFWDDAVNAATTVQNPAPRKANSPIVSVIKQFGPASVGSIKGTGGRNVWCYKHEYPSLRWRSKRSLQAPGSTR